MSAPRILVTDPQAIVQESFQALARSRSMESISLMEGALWFARGEEAEQIRDTLAALYISENDTPRLTRVLSRHSGALSPELVKAALAMLRNHALGTLDELPPQCERASVLKRMRECFDIGAYDVPSALFILSMLLQIGETMLALELTQSLFEASCRIEEGVLHKVLAALLAEKKFDEAQALLQVAVQVNRLMPGVPARLAALIDLARGADTRDTIDAAVREAGEDKVVQFIAWRFKNESVNEGTARS